MIAGGAEVDGEPEALSAKLAERLARTGLGPFGPVKIVGSDRNAVTFETAGPDLGVGGYGGPGFRRGQVRFARAGTRTRVEYVVETRSARRYAHNRLAGPRPGSGRTRLRTLARVYLRASRPEHTSASHSDDPDGPFPLAAVPLCVSLSPAGSDSPSSDGCTRQ